MLSSMHDTIMSAKTPTNLAFCGRVTTILRIITILNTSFEHVVERVVETEDWNNDRRIHAASNVD